MATNNPASNIDEETDKKAAWKSIKDSITACTRCNQEFSMTRRKHHCRVCEKAFCHDCSATRLRLPDMGYSEKVRVCDDCSASRLNSQAVALMDEIEVKNKINVRLKEELAEKIRTLDAFKTFLLEIESLTIGVENINESSDGSITAMIDNSRNRLAAYIQKQSALQSTIRDIGERRDELSNMLIRKDEIIAGLRAQLSMASVDAERLKLLRHDYEELSRSEAECADSKVLLQQQLDALKHHCNQLETELRNRKPKSKTSDPTNYDSDSLLFRDAIVSEVIYSNQDRIQRRSLVEDDNSSVGCCDRCKRLFSRSTARNRQ